MQAKPRRAPHLPDAAHYGELVRRARAVATEGLVLVTSGDWDYRELVLNWLLHCRRLGYANTLVLSMDSLLHADLERRGYASYDDTTNLAAWNNSCLQRHIQQVSQNAYACARVRQCTVPVCHPCESCTRTPEWLPSPPPLVCDAHALRRGWPVRAYPIDARCYRWSQVRMERHVASAALVAAGLDVLAVDATCVFLRNFVPTLRSTPHSHTDTPHLAPSPPPTTSLADAPESLPLPLPDASPTKRPSQPPTPMWTS